MKAAITARVTAATLEVAPCCFAFHRCLVIAMAGAGRLVQTTQRTTTLARITTMIGIEIGVACCCCCYPHRYFGRTGAPMIMMRMMSFTATVTVMIDHKTAAGTAAASFVSCSSC